MKILTILSSANAARSISTQLAHAVVKKLLQANSGSTVNERDLLQKPVPHLNFAAATAIHETDDDNLKSTQQPVVRLSDELTAELLDADVIVLGVPLYNYSIPSSLKAWIDEICRSGITFYYNEKGEQVGLLKNKKVYLATASGGIYSTGPITSWDHAVPYLKTMFASIGITDVTVYCAEGMGIPGIKEKALQNAIDKITV